jgi:hypothetical protein
VCTATLQAVGTGSLDSAYTEAEPEPGTAISDTAASLLTPEISGAQTSDVTITVDRGGLVDVENGARFRYTVGGVERGWFPPVVPRKFEHISSSTVTPNVKGQALAVNPVTGRPLLAYSQSTGSQVNIAEWREDLEIWQTIGFPAVVSAGYDLPHAAAYRSDGRALVITSHQNSTNRATMYYQGAFTDLGQVTGLPVGITGARASMVWVENSTFLLARCTSAGVYTQWVSDDFGASWEEVTGAAFTATEPHLMRIGRSFGLVHMSSPTKPVIRIVGSERDFFGDVGEVEINSNPADTVAACADPSGALYAYVVTSDLLYLHVSYDQGRTWQEFDYGVQLATTAFPGSHVSRIKVAAAYGGIVMVGGFVPAVASTGESIMAWWYGGYTDRVEVPGIPYTTANGYGFNTGNTSRTWYPFDRPGDLGWTMVGAGTDALTVPGLLEGLVLQYTTSANRRSAQYDLGSASLLDVDAVVKHNSGGSLGNTSVGLALRLADGTREVEARINVSSTGIRVTDEHGAVDLADYAITPTFGFGIQIRVMMFGGPTGGTIRVYVREYLMRATWNLVVSASLSDKAGAYSASGLLGWGNVQSGTADSEWRALLFRTGTGIAVEPPAGPFPPLPQPIPFVGLDGTEIAYLRAVGGPALLGSYELPAEHAYSVDHICIREHRSLAEGWRQTGTNEALLVYRLATDDVWLSRSLVFGLVGCNFRQAFLERWDGGAWQPIVELDLGELSGRTYAATGFTMYPASGSGTATRYLWRGELVGGHAVVSGVAYSIVANGAGPWNEGSEDTVRPFVRVLPASGPDVEDPTLPSTGTVDLVWPDGCAVYHAATPVIASGGYIRIRIPGGQACPDAGYACSGVLIGELRPFGADSDWGWTDERPTRVDLDEDPRGVLRVRERGPVGASWSLDWTNPLNHRQIRNNANLPFLGVSETDGNRAGFDDVFEFMHGIIAESVSGELPVVALHRMPESGETVTDRSLWLPGTLQATARFESVSGDERGVDEVGRVPSIVIRRLV